MGPARGARYVSDRSVPRAAPPRATLRTPLTGLSHLLLHRVRSAMCLRALHAGCARGTSAPSVSTTTGKLARRILPPPLPRGRHCVDTARCLSPVDKWLQSHVRDAVATSAENATILIASHAMTWSLEQASPAGSKGGMLSAGSAKAIDGQGRSARACAWELCSINLGAKYAGTDGVQRVAEGGAMTESAHRVWPHGSRV